MLGTNDTKRRFCVSAGEIAKGMELLIKHVRNSECGPGDASPGILLMAPPPITKLTEFADMFEGAQTKSVELAGHYEILAGDYDCGFLNCGDIIVSSDVDGLHLEAGEHAKLGQAVAEKVLTIFAAGA
jgi:lysophospholipase L1-like esterase